jgi:hypothetical protein
MPECRNAREKSGIGISSGIVSCLSLASIFLHQGSVRYRWSRTIPALPMPSSAQIICLPIGPYLSHYTHGCLSPDEVDRFGGWQCNREICGKEAELEFLKSLWGLGTEEE